MPSCTTRSAVAFWFADVVLWFAGTAVVAIWLVLRDPSFDYRFLIVGALLADLVDGLIGGPGVLHSVAGCAAVLVVAMAASQGRRQLRRSLLALCFGLFLHLVFDAAWADTEVFWWPASGVGLADGQLPVVARGWWNLALELAGAAMLVWAWRRFGLAEPVRRSQFWRTGQVGPDLVD